MINSSRKPRFFGWWVVGGSAVAMAACTGPLGIASFGVFLLSYEQEFGWGRANISWALSLLAISTAAAVIFVGRLVDRYGARRILFPSMIAMALCLVAIPMLVKQIWHLWLAYLLFGILAAGTNSVTFMPVLSAWFNKHRGLAIGLAVSGLGLGYTFVPVMVQYVIDLADWRAAYYMLAAIAVFIALPIAYFTVVQTPAEKGQSPDGLTHAAPKATRPDVGLTIGEVIRTRVFWMLGLIFLMISFVMFGVFVHLIPMLTDHGLPRQHAAVIASVTGGALFVGRIIIGFLVDRFFAPYVALSAFCLSAVGIIIFNLGLTGPVLYMAAVMIGFTIGAEADFLGYLASRYFGLKALATTYGLLLAAYAAGLSFGPAAFGIGYEMAGSYDVVLKVSLGVLLAAIILTALLPKFPSWDGDD